MLKGAYVAGKKIFLFLGSWGVDDHLYLQTPERSNIHPLLTGRCRRTAPTITWPRRAHLLPPGQHLGTLQTDAEARPISGMDNA
jgi:hypothetical protein